MKINEIERKVDNMISKKKKSIKIRTKSKKVLALSLVAILAFSFIASAAVLNSLSNQVTSTVEVNGQALQIQTRKGSEDWGEGEITLEATKPTAPASVFQMKVDKLADDNEFYKDIDHYDVGYNGAQVVGTLVAEISCPNGISTGDVVPGDNEFDSITIRFWGGDSQTYYNAFGHVYDETYEWTDFNVERVNNNRVRISGPTVILWDQWGYWGEVTVQFSQLATGTYTFEIEIVP